MNNLLEYIEKINREDDEPLAYRLRPKNIDDFVGQEHIVGKDKLLYRMIISDRLSSLILYGPPGTGKTSLAQVIANTTESEFFKVNATNAGKKHLEDVINRAKELRALYNKRSILFIDEIHRFNKAQQDYLLPFIEDGTIILIGATTENPYFEVNKAIISRCSIFQLERLTEKELKVLLNKAISSYKDIEIDNEAIEQLLIMSNGDARRMYNGLELAILSTRKIGEKKLIDKHTISECLQKQIIDYDKDGDSHYDTISAFIKSMRGSDPDAAIYYLARLLEAGEDIKFIARRIIICASEDVGLADPNALNIATSAMLACERIGMPEARIILAEAVLYIATAPKSNSSYLSIDKAIDFIRNNSNQSIPSYLKDGHYSGAKKLGNSIGYLYPHDYNNHYVSQRYLPDGMNEKFYVSNNIGYEKNIVSYLEKIRGDYEES